MIQTFEARQTDDPPYPVPQSRCVGVVSASTARAHGVASGLKLVGYSLCGLCRHWTPWDERLLCTLVPLTEQLPLSTRLGELHINKLNK